jgi:DNA gyrase subunit A
VDASVEERMAYLKAASARRRAANEEAEPQPVAAEAEEVVADVTLADERFAELELAEEFLLTVTDAGFGKRSSAYEYRVTGRGGLGIVNITLSPRTGGAVAGTFPVRAGDDAMLVTDAGRLIRLPADQVRLTGRASMGVTLFRLDAGERVTSLFPVVDDTEAAPETGPEIGPEIGPETGPEAEAGENGDV